MLHPECTRDSIVRHFNTVSTVGLHESSVLQCLFSRLELEELRVVWGKFNLFQTEKGQFYHCADLKHPAILFRMLKWTKMREIVIFFIFVCENHTVV